MKINTGIRIRGVFSTWNNSETTASLRFQNAQIACVNDIVVNFVWDQNYFPSKIYIRCGKKVGYDGTLFGTVEEAANHVLSEYGLKLGEPCYADVYFNTSDKEKNRGHIELAFGDNLCMHYWTGSIELDPTSTLQYNIVEQLKKYKVSSKDILMPTNVFKVSDQKFQNTGVVKTNIYDCIFQSEDGTITKQKVQITKQHSRKIYRSRRYVTVRN